MESGRDRGRAEGSGRGDYKKIGKGGGNGGQKEGHGGEELGMEGDGREDRLE